MNIEIINVGELIEVYNRHGEFKARGTVVRHSGTHYTHIVRMDEVQEGVYPYNYVAGGEYPYEAPNLSQKNHLRGGQRSIAQVADEPFDPDNPF